MTVGERFFKIRGYTPIPFLIVAVICANPTLYLVVAGVILILVGEALRVWGVSYAGSATRTRQAGAPFLVTNGPFAHFRNPLYVGNILIYVGAIILSGAWLPYLAIIVFFVFLIQYIFIIKHEEEKLVELFANEYKEYRNSVPKFIPRLSAYENRTDVKPIIKEALKSERSTYIAMFSFICILILRFYL